MSILVTLANKQANESARKADLPEAEIMQYLRDERRRRLVWALALLSVAAGGMTAVRVIVGGFENARPFGTLVCLAMLGLLYGLKRGLPADKVAVVVLSLLTVTFGWMAYLSGGLDSHFILMAVLLPMLAIHLHGLTAGKLCALAAGGVVLSFLALQLAGHAFPTLPVSETATLAIQGLATVVFIVTGTSILGYYAKLSDRLALTVWERANNDHLTGLANRRVIDSTLEREVRIARRNRSSITVLMVDVDHFKRYNDTFGHLKGDDCLREIARALEEVAMRPADIVGRYGGEEFIVVLPETHAEGAVFVAKRLVEAVRALAIPADETGHNVVTISVGVVTAQGRDIDTEQLVATADRALYQAKNTGRNRVWAARELREVGGQERAA